MYVNIVITPMHLANYQLHRIRNLRLLAMATLNITNTHYMYYQEFILYIERRVSYFGIPCTNVYREVMMQYLLSRRRYL